MEEINKIRNNERNLILEGLFSTFYFLIIQGAVFTALAIHFGLDEVLIGIAASFPWAFQIFQLLTPLITEKVPSRKKIVIFFNTARFLWLIAALYYLIYGKSPKMFLIIFGLTQAFGAISGNVWISLVRDLIPEEKRGQFFGKRNMIISTATFFIIIIYSWLLDYLHDPLNVFLVLLIASIGSGISLFFMAKVEDPAIKSIGLINELKMVFQDRNFLKLSFFYFYWNTIVFITAPFYYYHLLKNIKLPMTTISISILLITLLSILFYKIWGKTADHIGHKSILNIGIFLTSITPTFWLFANERYWIFTLLFDTILTAISWSAINISMLTLPMEVAETSSPMYFALFSAFGGIGGLTGSIFGGHIAKIFNKIDLTIENYHLFGLQIFLWIFGSLRITALIFSTRIQTRKYIPIKTMLLNVLSTISRRPLGKYYDFNRFMIVRIRKMLERMKKTAGKDIE